MRRLSCFAAARIIRRRSRGVIVVDVGERVVRRNRTDIPLAPKAFDLLLVLVSNRPNAVSHDRLHAAIWPGVHVSETSLPALVAQLRKALGDEGLIRTLHRIGYAFIGDAVIEGAATTSAIWRLIWRRRQFDMRPGESVIGRGRGCAAQIDAESVSRHHARLTITGGGVAIEDLGSKNGTWVNGERIHGVVALSVGAPFRLGSETVRLEMRSDEVPTKTESP
jgi:DNA-binding winged helix-turn-helix (wHTH) protein